MQRPPGGQDPGAQDTDGRGTALERVMAEAGDADILKTSMRQVACKAETIVEERVFSNFRHNYLANIMENDSFVLKFRRQTSSFL